MSKHKNDFNAREECAASSAKPENAPVAPEAAKSAPPAAPGQPAQADTQEVLVQKAGEGEERQEPSAADSLAAELESAKGEIASLRAEVSELNEKYLRKLADEVNFRKRMVREKEETQKYAVASLLGDLIPVLDDFDRGIASAETSKSFDQLSEGVVLIRKQLSQMLENKYALKRFESKGQPFDPNRHEALFAEPAEVEEPVVAEVYLPGYSLCERVLRTAKVRVKIPAPKKSPADGGQDGAEAADKA